MSADSEEDMQAWIDALRSAAAPSAEVPKSLQSKFEFDGAEAAKAWSCYGPVSAYPLHALFMVRSWHHLSNVFAFPGTV